MDLHFRAFSFVDRIHSIEAGGRISGHYLIPGALSGFSNSLVAEAVGQLAAWSSMAALDFTHRPVAGLAGRVELLSSVMPGQTLQLAAEVESVDEEAVSYGGTATVNGQPVLKLHHCVGPMMDLKEFDDPEQVRQRFNRLNGEGVAPGAFGGVPELSLNLQPVTATDSIQAAIEVPQAGDFFADHFPRKPVLPGTLLTHANLQLAATLMEQVAPSAANARWLPTTIADVKLRAFISPGETLELEARTKETSTDSATVAMQIRSAGRRIGSCRVGLTREGTA